MSQTGPDFEPSTSSASGQRSTDAAKHDFEVEGLLIPGVRKIAVLRANALGDYIFALPALHALRAAYPQAEIVLLGKHWHAPFLENRPGPVDRVVVTPPSQGVNTPADLEDPTELESFFLRMQAEKFDLALQMHGGGRHSNPFLLRLGARFTAGMKTPDAPDLDRVMPYFYWQHEALRLLEVAGLVGAHPIILEPHLEVTRRDIEESCQGVGITDLPLAILHPGASDPRRRWPASNFVAVGDTLARAGAQVCLVGIPEECVIVDQIAQAMEQPAINLCGRLSLHGLTGLLSRAKVVVANDSGPRHLAEAVHTPTVGIYWCGNLINAGSPFRRQHRPHLSWRVECPVCGKNTLKETCPHEASFVDEVTPEAVLADALDLLQQV